MSSAQRAGHTAEPTHAGAVQGSGYSAANLAKRLFFPAVGAGLAGGLLLMVVMILVMGTSGMGYAIPLNLGIPAFVYTISPPPAMLPGLIGATGISLPPSVMSQIGPMLKSGHYLSPAMAHQMGGMLMGMHVPTQKVQMMGALMTGHATNSTVATLMAQMLRQARHTVMASMPVSAGHVAVGAVLHFAFSAFLGVSFFTLIVGAAWMELPAMRTRAAMILAGVAGGAIVYAVNRWVLLPPTNPMMRLVPHTAFFLAHLLFGLTVGAAIAMVMQRRSFRQALPSRP